MCVMQNAQAPAAIKIDLEVKGVILVDLGSAHLAFLSLGPRKQTLVEGDQEQKVPTRNAQMYSGTSRTASYHFRSP